MTFEKDIFIVKIGYKSGSVHVAPFYDFKFAKNGDDIEVEFTNVSPQNRPIYINVGQIEFIFQEGHIPAGEEVPEHLSWILGDHSGG